MKKRTATELDTRSIAQAATASGLTCRECSRSHLQLHGGIAVVNVHFGDKGVTVYVQGTAKGILVSRVAEIIGAAHRVPRVEGRADRSRTYRAVKARKWSSAVARGETPMCHWCRSEFASQGDATADHVIPLSKGGSNGDDNIVLSCHACNSARKNRVTTGEMRTVNPPKRDGH